QAQQDIDLLVEAGVTSFNALLTILKEQRIQIDTRRRACWVLGQLGNKQAVSGLLEAYKGPDLSLSWEAAKSLGLLRSKRAVQPLIKALLAAGKAEKRAAAAYALGLLGDKRAVAPLINVLQNRSEAPQVRGYAAEALAYLRDRRAGKPLIAALRDPAIEVR